MWLIPHASDRWVEIQKTLSCGSTSSSTLKLEDMAEVFAEHYLFTKRMFPVSVRVFRQLIGIDPIDCDNNSTSTGSVRLELTLPYVIPVREFVQKLAKPVTGSFLDVASASEAMHALAHVAVSTIPRFNQLDVRVIV